MKPRSFIQKCKSYYVYKLQDPLLSMFTRSYSRERIKSKMGVTITLQMYCRM